MPIQLIKRRINSAKNIQKVTKVIQMIANSKLQSVQKKIAVADLAKNEIFDKDAIRIKAKNRNKKLYIAIGSDSGFCGSINASICKVLLTVDKDAELIIFGKKLNQIYKFRSSDQNAKVLKVQDLDFVNSEIKEGGMSSFYRFITDYILGRTSKIGEVHLVHYEFKNLLSKKLKMVLVFKASEQPMEMAINMNLMETEFGKFHFILSSILNRAVNSSLASVISSRVASMNSASKNAEEMGKSLTVLYNKKRQEKINKELLDIVSGSI